ncbi:dicer-like protein 4 isoform X2 [Beta vulgaris subsp. vulgaris]|uniref:dicer-like protein 4 isoform X2 n=1 Tax=Beta vulgaris subsp. vulgaris TaxID=3555 RepID=UPI0020376403|nr:dicer-like protein 4 isoform X2 [Beta vulgaris subsp. vulgaris]
MSGWDEGAVYYSEQAQFPAGRTGETNNSSDAAASSRHSCLLKFKEFIRSFETESNVFPYRQSLIHNPTSLVVNLEHLDAFDPHLPSLLRSSPADFLPLFENAASEVLASLTSKVAGETGEMEEPFTEDLQVLLTSNEDSVSIRSLGAQFISKLVKISGITIAASRTKAKATYVTLLCKNCKNVKLVPCRPGLGGAIIPRSCDHLPQPGEEPCPLDPWFIVPDRSKYVDQQTLKLQENPEDVPTGELPRNMLLSVDRHLVQTIVPGTRLTVMGIYSIFQANNASTSHKGAVAIRQPYIRVVGIEEANEANSRGQAAFTSDEIEEFKKFAGQPDAYQTICSKIAPSIFGHDDVKKAVASLLFGGSRKTLPDGVRLRGDINVLLLGDPSTAKSQFLKFVEKTAPVAVYTSGKGSSAAGLTASVIRDSGSLNLLVATNVGEEGLDIQTCCLVIRFDLPETLASFIQSRGRARMPQSEYAFLVDSENEREMNLMDSFRKDEDLMNMDIRDRKPNGVIADFNEEVYSVDSTGATISAQSSVSLLYHYCSKLPHDEYFNPTPEVFNVDDTEGTICHIILPSNAPIHHIVSAPQLSMEATKKDACLRACKELHQVGALTEYLLPEQDNVREEANLDSSDSDSIEDEDSPFELQEMVVPAALKEPWSDADTCVCLNSYFIRFKPEPHDRLYKEFGLFVKSPLPCEAEQMKVDLHLAHGRSVLTDLVPSGVSEFNKQEMLLALNFQEMCLKIILDRSEFMCGHVPLKNNKVSESNSSIFYLVLPVIPQECDNSISVDWMVIRRCLSSPIFAPHGHLLSTRITLDSYLQLADGPASVNDILNSLIYVSYKKSFFFVSQILPDKNGFSLHNSSTSHIEHLSGSFGIHLAHPGQPLLQAKQLFCLHNLLHDRKKGNPGSRELDEHFFELPPELCEIKIIGFSKDLGSSLSLLPSIMHRLENVLVAIELKDILSKSFAEGTVVTAERVLEALTTEQCHERFSLERLEVLGDAFLKFAVGRHLFLKHENFDEGQLTRRRSNLVNNSNLCKLAIKNKLQGYIRDQEFDPGQFFALGRPCSIICTKQTESLIHCDSEVNLRNGIDNRQLRCSKNHHWLTKKTIADVVEALVGAYIVDSGFKAAIAFLRWFGMQVEFEVSQVCRAWTASSRFMSLANQISIPDIEGIAGHRFVHKGLVLQAFVHPSYNRHGGGCYQRLEFLGDAVLDYLITSYLYTVFPELKPGQLTDLRSSLVNNSSFAQVAASGLYKYIICENNNLCAAIDKFVNFIRKPASERHLLEEPPCPKALGDLVESCIGAILLDTGFDLNHVWKVMLLFLNPAMRFSNLQLSPIRELLELCQYHGWDSKFIPSKRNRSFMVEAIVDGKSFASVTYRSIKGAKRMAAQQATQKLKAQGHRLKTKSLEEVLKTLRKMEARLVGYDEMPFSLVSSSELATVGNLSMEDLSNNCVNPAKLSFGNLTLNDDPISSACVSPDHNMYEVPTVISNFQKKSRKAPISSFKRQQHSRPDGDDNCSIDSDVHGKATARSRLHEICVKNCWRHPVYECCKEEGPSHLKLFTFKVVVLIEEAEDVALECFGRPQVKKKAAAEEAAEGAIWFLKKEGYIK